MPDPIFENARLTEIYDVFDGARDDLIPYLCLVRELKAKTVLDIGCGTGCFSCLLAENGIDVIGLEPAAASIEIAKSKPHADKVRWILGDMLGMPPLKADLAVMTGNVAQVFLDDMEWEHNLKAIHSSLNENGHFVFEVRDPSQKAWEGWTREKTFARLNIPGVGDVQGWCHVTEVSEKQVSFTWTYHFEADNTIISSDSTLIFRDKEEIEASLQNAGFAVQDVRDAPDRPGKEFVFIAKRV